MPYISKVNIDGTERDVRDRTTHGNITDAGAIGSAADMLVGTGNNGVLEAKSQDAARDILGLNVHHYGARWDKVNAQMTRTGDASGITTTITNFKHSGSINANKNNPFDSIYPWSERRLCNIDIDAYLFMLSSGGDLASCVSAWEGEADFSYSHENGVWVYTPEFWGKSWEDETYRYFDIADKPVNGYVHYKPGIEGRWHGGIYTRSVGGESKTVLLPCVGMPGKRVAISVMHGYAKNFSATLDNIFSIDATSLMCIIEYALFNTQTAVGNGSVSMYRQNATDLILEDASASATVKVLASAASAFCIPGAIFDIGTSNGGVEVGSFVVASAAADPDDATKLVVSLTTDGVTPASVTVTTANIWSVHGLINLADEGIGSDSGYIGTNGKSHAYYRGEVIFGNLWQYVLGAYRQTGTGHLWIAHDEEEADAYDAINTSVHYDTGIVLPQGDAGAAREGYINKLGMLSIDGVLSVPPFCTEVGGNSANPVGDYCYVPTLTAGNTILVLGGGAHYGLLAGRFSGYWNDNAGSSHWPYGARPRLKNP